MTVITHSPMTYTEIGNCAYRMTEAQPILAAILAGNLRPTRTGHQKAYLPQRTLRKVHARESVALNRNAAHAYNYSNLLPEYVRWAC